MSAQSPRPTESDGAGSRMTRRSLFKRAAVAGGTMVAVGGGVDRLAPRYSPIGRAQAVATLAAASLLAGGAIAGLLVGLLASGGGGDGEAINEARANELHDRIWLDGNEMQMTQTPLLESLEGDVSMLRQICRSDAAFALMQAASDEKSESDAIADGKAAVEDAVANVEGNFFDAWSSQWTRIRSRYELWLSEDAGGSASAVFQYQGAGNYNSGGKTHTANSALVGADESLGVSLVNGDSHSVQALSYNADRTEYAFVPWYQKGGVEGGSGDNPGSPYESLAGDGTTSNMDEDMFVWALNVFDRESSEKVTAINAYDWWMLHDSLLTLLDEERANVETMVETMYQEALDGDLALHEMSSASAILEQADQMENWKHAAGAYRSMVMPEAEDPAVIELENGIELEGLLFWTDPNPDDGLVVGETTNPDNTIGRIYMAAEIRSVPETPESETYDVTVTVVDDDTDATALEGIEITVKGTDATATTDANGEATLTLPEGPRTLYLSGSDSGGTSHETGQTFEISSENTSAEIVHDGGDRTSVNADPLVGETVTEENVGDVVIPYLTDPFTVVGIDGRPDASNLMFEEPDRVEPDDSFEQQQENSERAAEQEEETRSETTEIIIEETGGGGPGPIFGGGNPLEGGGGLLGLGIIGVVILAVFGIVTDAIPGLGN